MSVRVNIEIGHEASLRTKKTPEGFTHDWEVFVRGCDNAAIHYYIDKVVFHLHETFPKPKRVVKGPPYTVKESGYAGFNLPIDIYLKNKEEPKKIRFNYDLHLQQTGPPILKVQKEKYVFNSPNEEFKHKLIKGGGVIVNPSLTFQDMSENHTIAEDKMQMTSKPKLSGTSGSDLSKKHKVKLEDHRMSDSFQDLFGTPIKKSSKVSPEPKLPPKDVNKNPVIKPDRNISGSENKEKSKSKHSPHKDKDRDRDKSKEKGDAEKKNRDEKKKDKDRNKDHERSKDKSSKREKSPRSVSPKRSPKRPSSPKRPASPVSKSKEKDEKRSESLTKERDKKTGEEKSEKKSKKEKRDKDKEHKEKHKERDSQKISEHKIKNAKFKEKDPSPLVLKSDKKDKLKESDKERKETDSLEKVKIEEKPKHKHKKKDKEKRDKKEEREKSHKSEKKLDKNSTPTKYPETNKELQREVDKNSHFDSPKNEPPISVEHKQKDKPQKPLNALFSEFVDNDSSNSSLSSREPSPVTESIPEKPEVVKKDPIFEPKKGKLEGPDKVKVKKEKVKKNKEKKSEKDGEKKRKRKTEAIEDGAPADKIAKEEPNMNLLNSDVEQATSASPMQETDKENQENPEDYMQILKDLQHKIMTLQDNSELQKVVQLIAETGRFEVSARTFDFDLCLLERSTVRQLQEFFSSTS